MEKESLCYSCIVENCSVRTRGKVEYCSLYNRNKQRRITKDGSRLGQFA